MRKLLIIILCLSTICSRAQNVSLDWVKTWGSTNGEINKILCNDSEDNLYVVGKFEGTIDFDPGPGVQNRTSNGGLNIYILKLDSNGNFIWVNTFGNNSTSFFESDIVEKAVIDNQDNIILTGRFYNTVDFNPGLGVDNKSSNGFSDAYVLKLNSAGNYLWSATFGNTNHETSRGLAVNSNNDVFISGRFLDTVDFDPGIGVFNRSAQGVDIYILKLNDAGVFQWVKTLEGPATSSTQVNDLMCDNNNNLLLTGHFRDSIDLDPSSSSNYFVDVVDVFQYDMFVLKLDPSGNYVWAKQIANSLGNSLGVSTFAKDTAGHYYLGGAFIGTVDIDLGPGVYQLNASKICAYICKMDSNANLTWAKQMGGTAGISPEVETTHDMVIDSLGNVNLCGTFKGQEDFDPGPGIYYLGYPGDNENVHGFIMQLDIAGNFNWAKNLGKGPLSAGACNSIVQNSQGSLYITGEFYGPTDFDFNAGTNIITAQGAWDAYVLKIKNCSIESSIDSINSCQPVTWINGITYTVSNYNAKDTISTINGCDSMVTLHLTITSLDTIVNRTNNSFSANATAVTYQWVNCENNYAPIPGETNQSFTPTSNGSYAVIVSQGGCSDTSNCHSVTALSTKQLHAYNLRVYPNPTTGQVTVENNGSGFSLSVFNLLGQNLFYSEINKGEHSKKVNLSNLSPGVYMYTISHQGKLVLQDKILIH